MIEYFQILLKSSVESESFSLSDSINSTFMGL
jgi:hypothetical protein